MIDNDTSSGCLQNPNDLFAGPSVPAPHTPQPWARKKRALGNLFSFQTLLVQALETFTALEGPEAASEGTGFTLVSVLSCLFTNLALATAVHEALVSLTQPLTLFYQQAYG